MYNVKIPLTSKENFSTWYKTFYTQCATYNVHFKSCDDLKNDFNNESISKLRYNDPSASERIGQLLLNKLSEENTIDEKFKEGKDAISMVENGFQFLDIFLRQLHPAYTIKSVISENIPLYSDSKDLYKYCKRMKDYYLRMNLYYSSKGIKVTFLMKYLSQKIFCIIQIQINTN